MNLRKDESIIESLNHNDTNISEERITSCNENQNENSREIEIQPILQQCENCHRKQHPDHHGTYYELSFNDVSYNQVHNKVRKFKFLITTNIEDTSTTFRLCKCCKIHLTTEIASGANDSKNTWPGFIWYMLNDIDLINIYGKEYIWKFIPSTWRLWWYDSIDLSLDIPKPFFHDTYFEIEEWNELISSQTLPNLKKACNKHLVPKILCPYGCSAFLHRFGTISIDLIFQRYLQHVEFKKYISNKKYLSHVVSTRNDFIRVNDDYDY